MAAFAPAAIPPGRLPPAEAVAVARALGCPDLFVLDAADRFARERVLIQFLRCAAETGARLLVLSPDPAAADRIVESLASDRSLRVVRALADDENPLRPSQVVTALTGPRAGAGRAERLKREAAEAVAELEARLNRMDRAAEIRGKLEANERERAFAAHQAERTALEVERADLERSRPGFFARLFGFGPGRAKDERGRQIAERLKELDVACERIRSQLGEATRASQPAELEAEAKRLELSLRELLPQAAVDDTVENGTSPTATRDDLDRELTVARTRCRELNEAGTELIPRLLAETRIVIGTPGSLENDPVFAALTTSTPLFDRLVLDHAEELTDEVLDSLAPLASRWVLAGDAAAPVPPANGRNGRSSRLAEPSLLCRLARHLDREPWCLEGDRLIVRRTHLPAGRRAALVREALIDHPEVELAVMAEGEPVLAEIAFPAETAIPAAKSFLFTQLGEVALRPCGEPVWHRESRLTACWPILETDGEWIELEAGVRERVVGNGLASFTAAVDFDPTRWDAAAAEAWLADRIAPDSSRVARLPAAALALRPAAAR